MKYLFLFVFISFSITVNCQPNLFEEIQNHRLEKLSKEQKEKEKWIILRQAKEIELVNKVLIDKYSINLLKEEKLHIIQGYDCESLDASGRIWNNKFDIRYKRKIEFGEKKISKDSLIVHLVTEEYLDNTKYPILRGFDVIVNLVEERDTSTISEIKHEYCRIIDDWLYNVYVIENDKKSYNVFEFEVCGFYYEYEVDGKYY